MKIGVCATPDKLPLLEELGYDYVEANFNWMTSLSEDAYAANTALFERSSLAAEAFCIFFGGGTKLYAPDGKQDDLLRSIAAYAETGFARAERWGGKIAVIGSGGARAIPQGMTREEVEPQFARVLAVCGEAAERHGMRIVVEPLSRTDCNYIHTEAEGAAAARLAAHPAVGLLVDFYHHQKNNDDLDTIPDYADILWHAHTARAGDRLVPDAKSADAMKAFAEVLKKCPLTERISLECIWKPDYDTAVTAARPYMEIFRTI